MTIKFCKLHDLKPVYFVVYLVKKKTSPVSSFTRFKCQRLWMVHSSTRLYETTGKNTSLFSFKLILFYFAFEAETINICVILSMFSWHWLLILKSLYKILLNKFIVSIFYSSISISYGFRKLSVNLDFYTWSELECIGINSYRPPDSTPSISEVPDLSSHWAPAIFRQDLVGKRVMALCAW